MNKYNSKEIELAVANYFGNRKCLIVPNVSWGFNLNYEADLVVVTKSGMAKEIEIKVSKADLLKDKEKKHQHDSNKFAELYFAIPEKLLKHIEHIPERAGVLVCKMRTYNHGRYCVAELFRPANKRRIKPLSIREQFMLARLGTMRIWNLKRKIFEDSHKNKNSLKKQND